jgi:hypothetical protein
MPTRNMYCDCAVTRGRNRKMFRTSQMTWMHFMKKRGKKINKNCGYGT